MRSVGAWLDQVGTALSQRYGPVLEGIAHTLDTTAGYATSAWVELPFVVMGVLGLLVLARRGLAHGIAVVGALHGVRLLDGWRPAGATFGVVAVTVVLALGAASLVLFPVVAGGVRRWSRPAAWIMLLAGTAAAATLGFAGLGARWAVPTALLTFLTVAVTLLHLPPADTAYRHPVHSGRTSFLALPMSHTLTRITLPYGLAIAVIFEPPTMHGLKDFVERSFDLGTPGELQRTILVVALLAFLVICMAPRRRGEAVGTRPAAALNGAARAD